MRGEDGRVYEPPAVEHREPIEEPAVLGSLYQSPWWKPVDDDKG